MKLNFFATLLLLLDSVIQITEERQQFNEI